MNIIELAKECGACDDDSSAWGELFTFESRELAQFSRAIYEDAAAILDANADEIEAKQGGDESDLSNVLLRHHALANRTAAEAIRVRSQEVTK